MSKPNPDEPRQDPAAQPETHQANHHIPVSKDASQNKRSANTLAEADQRRATGRDEHPLTPIHAESGENQTTFQESQEPEDALPDQLDQNK